VITVRRKPCSTGTPPVDPRNIYMGASTNARQQANKAVVSYRRTLACSKWYRRDQMSWLGKPSQAYPS
jgi:hypothetical protein